MFSNEFSGSPLFGFVATMNLRVGPDAIKGLAPELASQRFRRAMVVTDPGVLKAGIVEPLLAALKAESIDTLIFSEVEPNPRDVTIQKGSEAARDFGADVYIGFGGGSAMDTAKGIAMLTTNDGCVADYDGTDKVKNDLPYLVAVPTTAGTGSEVTANAAVTHSETHYKMSVRSPKLLPKLAIIDPLLLRSLPRHVAATAGLDALSHAIEGYLSVRATPISDIFAREAIRLIGKALRPFVANPANVQAATAMLLGSTLAGLVISNTGTGNDHAIARALGGIFDTPHGLATGLLLPHVMRFNAHARPERYRDIASDLGLCASGDAAPIAWRVCDEIEQLVRDVGVPTRLSDIEVDRSKLESLVEISIKNVGPNPRRTSPEEMRALIESAW